MRDAEAAEAGDSSDSGTLTPRAYPTLTSSGGSGSSVDVPRAKTTPGVPRIVTQWLESDSSSSSNPASQNSPQSLSPGSLGTSQQGPTERARSPISPLSPESAPSIRQSDETGRCQPCGDGSERPTSSVGTSRALRTVQLQSRGVSYTVLESLSGLWKSEWDDEQRALVGSLKPEAQEAFLGELGSSISAASRGIQS